MGFNSRYNFKFHKKSVFEHALKRGSAYAGFIFNDDSEKNARI